jgi:hypothetical protein
MAKSTGQVTKIYQLRTLGYDQIHKELQAVAKDFDAIKKAKREAETGVANAKTNEEAAKYRAELNKIKLEEAELRKQRQAMINEAKAEQLARQAAIRDEKERGKSAKESANSYNALYKEYRELYNLVKNTPKGNDVNFRGQLLSYDQAIAKLKQLAAAEQDFRRQFQRDGLLVGEYTSGIIQAFKRMGLDDLVRGQITKAQARLKELDTSLDLLKQELKSVGTTGAADLEKIEKQLIDNRNEANSLNQSVAHLRSELRGTGDIGSQITAGLSAGFKEVKTQLAQLLIGYLGFQAAFAGITRGVETAKELSDQTTNLEIELGKAKGGAEGLVNELAKLDTRTKLTVLEEMANIAAKAGVSEQELLGVTAAIDKIKIAFGKDFGNVEEGTETLVKLINIFLGTDQVTGDNLLRTGNALRTLANESVASVPFLNDFSKRMAGLKGISDITLPAVLGLGSGFEQFGQSAEVSSTALVKIIPKLASDTAKYAAIAGVTTAAFKELLKSRPEEALIAVAQGLVKGKDGIEDISAAFADSELGKGRIASVLGVLGKNADAFRHSIDSAGKSFNDTGNIETAFAAKNENLAATLDKVSKRFADAANSKTFQASILAISSIITFIIGNIPLLLTLLGVLATSWAINNVQLLLLRGSLVVYNLLILRNQVLLAGLTVVTNLNRAAMFLLNGSVALVTKGFQLLGLAIKGTPIGIILTAVSLLATAFAGWNAAMAKSSTELERNNERLRIMKDIQVEAARAISDQVAKLQGYAAVVRDTSISEQTRLSALQELIKINPEFSKALQGNKIDLDALNTVLKDYNANLLRKAELEAAQALQQREFSELVRLQTLKQSLEVAKAQKTGFGDLNDEQRGAFSKITTSVGRTAFSSDLFNASISNSDFAEAFKDLNKEIATQADKVGLTTDLLKDKYTKAVGVVKDGQNTVAETIKAQQVEVDIAEMSARIKELNEQIEAFRGSQKDLNALVKERKDLQEALNKALGINSKQPKATSSKISGPEKDALRDIDAGRDQLLAQEKLKRAKNEIDEETYLNNILTINQKAIDQKLELIKGSNAAERKLIADLRLERITSEQETNNKIFELRKTALQIQVDNAVKNAQDLAKTVVDDPTSSAGQRAQAKLDADKKILELQVKYAADIDKLEKDLGQQSLKNAKQAADDVRKTKQQILADEKEFTLASLKDIQDAGTKSVAEFKAFIAQQRLAVVNNEELSPTRKEKAFSLLDREENIGILAREVASLQIQLPVYKRLLAQKKITDEDYYKFIEELNRKQKELAEGLEKTTESALRKVTGIGDLVKNALRDLLKIKPGSANDDLLGEALAQTYAIAQEAMNQYFDAEQQRIRDSRDSQIERLDLEKAQVLARASTKAEEESIEKQFAAKKKAIDQKAGQDLKKAKIQEAKISFAIELANIAASAAANPANAATFGAAGAIQFAVLGALAGARYLLRVNDINRTQFAFGGRPGDVPTRGGKFGGDTHSRGGTPFAFKGQSYEAQVDELAVIRTQDAPRNKVFSVVGTQAQLASAANVIGGGVNFAPGAKMKRFAFGGNLGESLQAPVFVPSSSNTIVSGGTGLSTEQFDQFLSEVKNLATEQSKRIDRLEVVQVTNSVTAAQKKQVNQSEVGTL